MKRRRQGSIQRRDGKWWARVRFTGDDGKQHEKRRLATSKTDAATLLRDLLNDADKTDGRSLSNDARTFNDLADHYEADYLVPIRYDAAGKKQGEGMRGTVRADGKVLKGSLYTAKLQLRMLREEFGNRRLRSISYADLRRFRDQRFDTPTKARRCAACNGRGTLAKGDLTPCAICQGARSISGKRSRATVNREMTMLNRMLNIAAKHLGWIIDNPFTRGKSLVELAKEEKRDVILGRAEEARLLAACDETTTEGHRVRAIVVCAVDTGMRQAEIFGLRWDDVDLNGRTIRVRAENTKTLTERRVPMTSRVRDVLIAWREAFPVSAGEPLFGYTANVKRNYGRARAAAGLTHVRFHDLRHTAATRMIQGGTQVAEVGRILGHTDLSRLLMTYRYINTDDSTLSRAAAVLDAANAEAAKQQPTSAPQAVN